MALPPGFLDELRGRVTLSSVIGRKVTWDARKSNMAKGDFWAPCPFHQEKTASFHVDDRKGFYYCFGCHAKGDAVTFLKEAENLGFIEAVRVLAGEAGMAMPDRDPKAAEQADRRTHLVTVMEEAVLWLRLQLKTSAAAEARAYLAKRGLSEAAQERWELGFAPDQRQGLMQALTAKGFAMDEVVEAGLCARTDDGQVYDRFRGRIIFPIRDARGRAISLGGRAMDPNARAKYLNGPESPLFDKGRSLFNHARAREAAGKGQRLIVAEGYMDVIALSEAGFGAVVAPLGTAITEDQLALIWRIAEEPVIALDGDAAGQRAALRAVDLALPLLRAGNALRFAILPKGLDPDDLIRTRGPAAMQGVLDGARPLVDLLWAREIEGRVFDSPERRAALDAALRAVLARIADPSIRAHTADAFRQRRFDLFGQGPRGGRLPPQRRGAPGRFRDTLPQSPVAATLRSDLAQGQAAEETLREAVILAVLVRHTTLVSRFHAELARIDLTGPGHDRLRQVLLGGEDRPETLPEALRTADAAALDALLQRPHLRILPACREGASEADAVLCLAEELARLEAFRAHRREVEDAVEDFDGLADEGLTWRLEQAVRQRRKAERGGRADEDPAGDGFGEDRAALSQHLQEMIDSEVWIRKKR